MTNKHDNHGHAGGTGDIFWWAKLVVAVLAIPSLGAVIATMAPLQGLGQMIVFVLACWACTFLGMKLMQNAPD
jgi:hypothetical protein